MTSDDLLMTSDCVGTSVRRHVFSIRAVMGPAVHACAHHGARSPQVRRHVFSLEALEEGRAAFANETVHAQV